MHDLSPDFSQKFKELLLTGKEVIDQRYIYLHNSLLTYSKIFQKICVIYYSITI